MEFSIIIVYAIITESKEVSSTTGTLEERDKDIERMRTEIQRLQGIIIIIIIIIIIMKEKTQCKVVKIGIGSPCAPDII